MTAANNALAAAQALAQLTSNDKATSCTITCFRTSSVRVNREKRCSHKCGIYG
jgi:hypothetical protein